MRGGLILDMENKNALITNAMLTVYIDEKKYGLHENAYAIY